nr:class I SAM-dependent methyltransferase [Candidatus Sigynarchaeota archaeon]
MDPEVFGMTKKTTKPGKPAAKKSDASEKKHTEDHAFYKNPLYYDIVFDGDIKDEIEFYKRCFDEYAGVKVKKVLEPACGNGLYLEMMAKAGFTITGYDLAPEMVKYSQERVRKAGVGKAVTVVEGDMRSITFKDKFDAAINQINSLAYLTKDADIISHFKVTADSLVDGGIYIVELTLKCDEFEQEHKKDETWTMERDGVVCTATWRPNRYDVKNKLRHIDFKMHVDDHGKTFDVAETHELRLWTYDDIVSLVKAGGLDLVAAIDGIYKKIPDGARITGDTYEFPYFILKKPSKSKK